MTVVRDVLLHPKVDRDLSSLPRKVQNTFHDRVDFLRTGNRHTSTHPLHGPLKGWLGTSVGGNQYRMVHKNEGDQMLVLSVGNHDEAYNSGIRRSAAIPEAERTESVDHMLKHYQPTDFATWKEVHDNLDWDHPKMRDFVQNVRRNGVQRPIPVDYEQNPPQVMNGHTRLLAAHKAGIKSVPTRQHEGFMDPDDPDHLGRGPDDPEHWTNQSHWAMRRNAAEEYWMNHRPGGPSFEDDGAAAPAHELDRVFPSDVYKNPHFYGSDDVSVHGGGRALRETAQTLRRIRGNPEADVTMYRSLPHEHADKGFRTGDWVSLHHTYAQNHGLHPDDPSKDWPVIKATVKAKHLWNDGNSIDEFGYHGPPVQGERSHHIAKIAKYDNLSLHDSTNPDLMDDPTIEAHHPEHGHIGTLTYRKTQPMPEFDLPHGVYSIQQLDVHPDHRRQGVGSTLMHELERRAKGVPVEHGIRTPEGHEWAKGYYGDSDSTSWTLDGKPHSNKYFASWIEDAYGKGAREFQGDSKWLSDGGAPHPKFDFERGAQPDKVTIPHDHPLVSGQSDVDERFVNRLREDRSLSKGRPDLLQLPNGDHMVMDGHHRLLADRREGKPTDVHVWHMHQMLPDAKREYAWMKQLEPRMAVQQPPDDLSFQHEERETGGSKWPARHTLTAQSDGEEAGKLRYFTSPREKKILIDHLGVETDHQRKGIGSALMDELQRRHSDASIDHGDRTDAGKAWWKGYSQNKTVRRGRTAEIDRQTGAWILYHGTSKENAERIEQEGFKHGMEQRNGNASGNGFYFHEYPHQAREYGSHVVVAEADVPDFSIHHNPWADPDIDHNHVSESAQKQGFHGHVDPDDHAVVLYHPHEIHYLTHGPVHHFTSLGSFTPHLRVFAATCGLDHRLWTQDEKLKPDVRAYILQSVSSMWGGKYANWSRWARVYFAGSEASEWTSPALEGNNDFDVLIGVDYDKFRRENPAYKLASNQQITDEMNDGFKAWNGPVILTIDGVQYGPFDRTSYVNPDSYDIRNIKPYAAYDVSADKWVVKPPHLPHWDITKLPEPVRKVLRASDTLARNILKLPEPERTQQGAALFDAWHSDRSRAFGPNGEGWWDIANLREKWTDQAGLWAELVNCKHRFDAGFGAALPGWSNMPRAASMDSDTEHMPLSEFRKLRGGDYNVSVPELRKRLQRDYEHGTDSPHPRAKEFGGANQYIDHLKANISEHGLQEPIELGEDRRGEFIADGHHRAAAVHELGIDPVPVLRGSPYQRAYAKLAGIQMMKPSDVMKAQPGRTDLDQPHMQHKMRELRNSILNNGYVHQEGDEITIGHGPNGPVVTNGNKRLKALDDLGFNWPIPVKTSVMVQNYKHNPDRTWYHGSNADFEQFEPGHSNNDYTSMGQDWNSRLGHHFSTEKDAAASRGRILYHTKLGMKNPKVYRSEFDLTREVANHELNRKNYYKPPTTLARDVQNAHEDGVDVDEYDQRYGGEPRGRSTWLDDHPDLDNIVRRHWNRLRRQGHDGIVYGNEVEGRPGHASVIVDPKKISIVKKERLPEEKEFDWKHLAVKTAAVKKTAAPWFDAGDVSRPRPKSVRRAGFAGFVADSRWQREFEGGKEADQPDHIDNHLSHFVRAHSSHWAPWDAHGEAIEVHPSKQPIYATQSHVSQYHTDRYRKNPNAKSWAAEEDPVFTDDYPGHFHPLMVTHQNRLHAIEGHHRVAAGIQDDRPVKAMHYDLDKHPVVEINGNKCPECERYASSDQGTAPTSTD